MDKQQKLQDLQLRNLVWVLPWEAVALIAKSEDCILNAYICPAGKPTIGWGETDNVQIGMRWTKEQADKKFNEQVNEFATRVKALCKAPANQYQLGAFTSLAYNIGVEAFSKSTVLKAHNAGDTAAASRAFHLWNKARINGKLTPLKGLTARRAAESALYLREDDNPFPEAPVQAVAHESKMIASPINVAGATGTATGAVALASGFLGEAAPVVAHAKNVAESIGVQPIILLGLVILAAGVSSMYYRYKQRSGGWA